MKRPNKNIWPNMKLNNSKPAKENDEPMHTKVGKMVDPDGSKIENFNWLFGNNSIEEFFGKSFVNCFTAINDTPKKIVKAKMPSVYRKLKTEELDIYSENMDRYIYSYYLNGVSIEDISTKMHFIHRFAVDTDTINDIIDLNNMLNEL